MKAIIAKDVVNKGRQLELDLARGLAVFFMVLIHIQEYFMTEIDKASAIGGIVDFLGGIPAAPVFMFLMGVGFVYSRRATAKDMFVRGLKIFALGYVLSFFRGTAPSLFQAAFYGPALGYDLDSMVSLGLNQVAYIDIFQFSGLAMMAFAAFKALELKPYMALVLAGLFATANSLLIEFVGLIDIGTNSDLLIVAVSGLLWGTSHISFFPFLTWIIYPLVGYYFGSLLVRCANKDAFYGLVGGLGSLLYFGGLWFVYEILDWPLMIDSATEYYHHGGFDHVVVLGFVLLMLSALYFINRIMPFIASGMVGKLLINWSAKVTPIYFVHWLVIGWLVPIIGYNTLPLASYAIVVILVMTASNMWQGASAAFMGTRS